MNDYEREHNAMLRRSGGECAVLLKSNGAFPLNCPCELALYGSGARRTIKGGTGSGEVNSRTLTGDDERKGGRISTPFSQKTASKAPLSKNASPSLTSISSAPAPPLEI